MKTLATALLAIKLLVAPLFAAAITPPVIAAVSSNNAINLAWSPPSYTNQQGEVVYEQVAGYIIYQGPISITNYWATNQANFSNWAKPYPTPGTQTNLTVTNIPAGQRNYWVAVAVDDMGVNSDFSNEINTRIPLVTTNTYLVVGAIIRRARTTNGPYTLIGIRPVYQEPYTNQPFGVYQLTPTVNLQITTLTN